MSKIETSDNQSLKDRIHLIIFEADTPAGKFFDISLIVLILCSVLTVMLESVAPIRESYGALLSVVEWIFTILFTIEYVTRLWCVRRSMKYALSFFGVIDLLAILPTYLSILFPGTHYLLIIRILRVLRVFRVLKLVQYLGEAELILKSLRASAHKLFVFICAVFALVVILGAVMYVVEGEEHGFTSIPKSIYWAIVTLTTVGYGDISPNTNLGQAISAVIMLLGYSLIAVPTGIVTVAMGRQKESKVTTRVCQECFTEGHERDAIFCKICGGCL